MNTVTLHFKADNQQLTALDGLYKLASNTVEYVKAIFTLGENWAGFDVVRAAWYTDFECISTVLDGNGECFVPWEVLSRPEGVTINLYGCDLEEESDGEAVLVDRLTTYPVKAILVDVDARVCGSETKPVTPSQFEQYIAIVQELVGTVRDITSCVLNPDYTLTINYSDDTSDTVGPIRGEQGEQGPTGPAGNGISKIEKISTVGLVDTYRITFTNGTHKDYTVTNGAKGDTGNGIESIYLTGTSGAVKTYTILFTNGDTFEYQVTDGEVTRAELEAVLPTDTASEAIASFPDGSDLFDYLSCVVNIDPVQDLHGYDKPWVGGAGVNKFDATKQTIMDANKVTLNGETFTMTWTDGSIMITGKGVQTFPAGTYYFSATGTGDMNNVRFGVYNASTNTSMRTQAPGFSFTASDEFYLIIYGLYSAPGTATFKVQIEQGSTGTIWKPFANICPITGWTGCNLVVSPTQDAQDGTTYPVSWQTEAGTVYGGTVDVVTGVLTAYPYYASYNGETLVGPWVSSMDEYIEGRTPTTGAQVVDLGGTPTTYQLTPTQIHALLGQNNVWANCGDTSVTYKADVKRWVEKKLGA